MEPRWVQHGPVFASETHGYDWPARGADGRRLDAAYAVPTGFWAAVLPRVRAAHPDAYLVGEVIHRDYAKIVAETGLDSVTPYGLWKAVWSSLNNRNEGGWATFRLHQDLIGLPRRHAWLHRARTRVVDLAREHLIYEAADGDDRLVVAPNLADTPARPPGSGDRDRHRRLAPGVPYGPRARLDHRPTRGEDRMTG